MIWNQTKAHGLPPELQNGAIPCDLSVAAACIISAQVVGGLMSYCANIFLS